ncbi:hypothetical protein OO007_17325 [Cocleimonas sp. KMM 6892]|uniref:hypothetical protein n=1 Tax=unclassified Cocleimonas TaxID=2639732 RepID=UPI002DB55DDF|nr:MULTISPECIES: hypothetical protein [unclassified Cocleimonas]MEB8434004.1 hypothetical protein [Cocleimonas sp. KMM 6892]MEC4716815.1 hypothetical protein [Cocleimonas sp. KMM 6895]MEC4746030.1 hypothetical protein [Cocleimonas sp. KMM 6896]
MTVLAKTQKIEILQKQDVVDLEHDVTLKLEIKRSTLKRLLETKQVCASDFRCMDCITKRNIQELCLETCLKCLAHSSNN